MEEVQFKLEKTGTGSFYILENNEEIAQMVISISGKTLTAHHTEVYPKGEGKGMGKRLLEGLTNYARKNGFKVIALCPFVHAQFKKHPETYRDILTKNI